MTGITDEILDRHAAQGVIATDQFRRGDGPADEAKAITNIMAASGRMSKIDGITDKGLIGFLAMGAICHFHLRLMDIAGGAQ